MSTARLIGHSLRRTVANKPLENGQEASVLSWSCECGVHLGDAPDVNTHGVRKLHRAHKESLNA